MRATRLRHENFAEVWEFKEPAFQFHCYIALHHLGLGPGLGGVRIWKYSKPEVALAEVLRLARQMTFKAAIAGLPFGGGKAVLLLPNSPFDRKALLHCFGRAIQCLEGRYITAKDVGSSAQDMALISQETKFVTGLPVEHGGTGDPSPLTAYGVFRGIDAGRNFLGDTRPWSDYRVDIQGIGGVGSHLAQELRQRNVQVWATDTQKEKLLNACRQWGLNQARPQDIFTFHHDCLAPCAMGQILNAQIIPKLKVSLVAGGANDQLLDEQPHALALKSQGILYAPDFVINSGGLIHVAYERLGKSNAQARAKTDEIAHTLTEIFTHSEQENCSTHESALRVAQHKLNSR